MEKFDTQLQEQSQKKRTLAAQYKELEQDREPYLTKARESAKYTLPSLLKKDDSNVVQVIETPNQSIGADGVNNLAAKVTLAILPPNQPFFKFTVDSDDVKREATEAGYDKEEYNNNVTKGLALTEQLLVDYNEHNGDRICLGEAMKHLYIAGNVFLVHQPKLGLKYYPLNRYVVKRDYCGNVIKALTTETVGYLALPEDIREKVAEKLKIKENKTKEDELKDIEKKEFTLYTIYHREGKHWITYQEVEGIEIPETKGKYPIEVCPFIALRYTRIDGESYGRGLIEEYIGDISYLDVLSKAIKDASLAASKLIILVNPNGQTSIKQLSKTKNGGFCAGREEDVKPLQVNKYYDLRVAREEKESIEKRLYRIFMLAQAVQRDSERTTATEIQYMIRDLEEALGNHYSIMSKEFQLAYIKISFFHLRKEKKNALPDLIRDEKVKLTVTTGLEALGRGSELQKWNTWLETMGHYAQIAQAVGARIDILGQKVATSLNLDIEGVLYSEEEKQAMQEQANEQELTKAIAPNMITQAGNFMNNTQSIEAKQQG